MQTQRDASTILRSFFSSDGLVVRVLEYAEKQVYLYSITSFYIYFLVCLAYASVLL